MLLYEGPVAFLAPYIHAAPLEKQLFVIAITLARVAHLRAITPVRLVQTLGFCLIEVAGMAPKRSQGLRCAEHKSCGVHACATSSGHGKVSQCSFQKADLDTRVGE